MFFGKKIFPVIDEVSSLKIDSNVYIFNPDDDMHLQTGKFKGNFKDKECNIHSLIILDDNNKNFYTLPHTLRIIN